MLVINELDIPAQKTQYTLYYEQSSVRIFKDAYQLEMITTNLFHLCYSHRES